tara:strand:- start:4005 stop:4217 length:213 start_codon:yes stop_codon:yes gene_type:complete
MSEGISIEECEKIDISKLIGSFTDIGIVSKEKSSSSLNYFDIAIPVFHNNRPLAFMLLADIEGKEWKLAR